MITNVRRASLALGWALALPVGLVGQHRNAADEAAIKRMIKETADAFNNVSFLQLTGCVKGDYFWRPPDSDELLVPFVM